MSSTLPEPSEVTGAVHAIVFHNEENGYTIMQVETGDVGLVAILGNLPAVIEGEQVRARGHWKSDRQYGKQFQADTITAIPPNSADGIRRFLASGLIEGIGKTYAKRIVEKFGTETFRIIEEESQRLEEISGVGMTRRQRIKESWKKQKSIRDIMIFLHAHGLSTARAMRLHKTYGAEAANILRQDPYRLARELPGVGFKTADDIARKMGSTIDSPKRIEAGIEYILHQAEKQGHSALTKVELISEAIETLGTIAETIEIAIDRLILDGRIVAEQNLIFQSSLHEAEETVARSIQRIVAEENQLPEIDPIAAIEWFERHHKLQLGDEQKKAVITATKHRISILTGGPGVGKTTILRAIISILSAKKVEIVLAAPTGRAAQRLSESTGQDASTIHRLLEFQPTAGFARNADHQLDGDLFVIDETSMVDIRLMASLLAAIPSHATVLLVGDVDQLPSVGPGNVLRDLIATDAFTVSRLTKIYRQAETSRIITAAHEINFGEMPDLQNDGSSDFFFIERSTPEAIAETMRHLVSERIPESFQLNARDDIQILTPMNKQSLGTAALNQYLQNALNPPTPTKLEVERFGITYRVGDKVIQTRNDYDKEIFNGDIGYIVEITLEPVSIYVNFEGNRQVSFEPGELDELQLAYAITIHKSQGSEFPAVIIPLAGQHYVMLQRNLIYTALTRGKRLVIIVGEKSALQRAVRNGDGSRRFSGLAERIK